MTSILTRRARKGLLAGILLSSVIGSGLRAMAQTQAMQVQVPFAFLTGKQVLPAGTYNISSLSSHLISVRSTSTRKSAFLMTIPEQRLVAATKGKVVFRRLGQRYLLTEVWHAGDPTGSEVALPRRQRVELANIATPDSTVELALNLAPR